MKLRRAPTLVLATAALSGDPHTDEEDLHATACARLRGAARGDRPRARELLAHAGALFEADDARAVLGLDPTTSGSSR